MLSRVESRLYTYMAPFWSEEQRVMAPVAARQSLLALTTLALGAAFGLAAEHHSIVLTGIGALLLAIAAGVFGQLLGYVSLLLSQRAREASTVKFAWPTFWRALIVVAANLYLGYELGGDCFSHRPWAQSGARVVLGMLLALAASVLLNRYLWKRLSEGGRAGRQ